MPMITRADLMRFAPHATAQIADAIVSKADVVFPKWEINTPARLQAFMAHASIESAGFTTVFESLNYSAEALLRMWPSHFTPAQAQQYGRTNGHAADQRMIANLAYGSRMGNRGSNTDDGWLCRGTGLLQATGLNNFARLAKALDVSVDTCRAMLSDPEHMLECAVATFVTWGCLPFADKGDLITSTKLINGGTNGLADRQKAFALAQRIWPVMGKPNPSPFPVQVETPSTPPKAPVPVSTFSAPVIAGPHLLPPPAKQSWGDWLKQFFFARPAA